MSKVNFVIRVLKHSRQHQVQALHIGIHPVLFRPNTTIIWHHNMTNVVLNQSQSKPLFEPANSQLNQFMNMLGSSAHMTETRASALNQVILLQKQPCIGINSRCSWHTEIIVILTRGNHCCEVVQAEQQQPVDAKLCAQDAVEVICVKAGCGLSNTPPNYA